MPKTQTAPATIRGCKVVKAADKNPTLYVYDQIGPGWLGMVDAMSIAEALDEIGDATDFDLRINSPGGVCDQAAAIYNLLREHSGKVTVKVDGIAASAASIVMMAGDEIEIAANARVMIHEAWCFMAGNKREMLKEVEVLQGYDDAAIATYVARTGGDEKQITEWIEAETWFTADEAVEHGFADRKTNAAKNVTIRVPKGRYKHVPQDCEQFDCEIESQMRLSPPAPRPPKQTAETKTLTSEPEPSRFTLSPNVVAALASAARARAGLSA
jgi:ATP-dependent Clp protease protease subunit